ncbi:c-type cytochrome [Mucilaginibacter sp. HC2]|uniref:cbb3-type cytochrome c oxidase N-terminal domain-containing protein n=1 Tax=Mucilaginibacter inviolabilis TaxID=2714892 RepID=UPI00140B3D20|nr:cbb3-type cytochrome c oxidase N-terminal domain-containing protein [Mucilaginibacter inviolabilis]NHA02611.1 c-type cytochrome [Mucilaginibacter inviolabilis]
MKKISTLILTLSAPLLTIAEPAKESGGMLSGETQNQIGYWLIGIMLFLFLIVVLVLVRTIKVMARVIFKYQGTSEEEIIREEQAAKAPKKAAKPKNEILLKLMSLKPMSEEKSLLIEHDYDGIQELNNPTPAWFMWLFYGTITFGVCYILIYHVFNLAPLQYQEYRNEMAQADIAKKEYLSKAANRVDENTVKLVNDPAVIAAGGAIFKTTCAPCHGDHAQGNVGPNLTDDYWLHGGKINDIFKTIKYGVAAKGMPTWEKQLSPKQISDVANFIKSIHGTNPANPKAPQGEKEAADEPQKVASK